MFPSAHAAEKGELEHAARHCDPRQHAVTYPHAQARMAKTYQNFYSAAEIAAELGIHRTGPLRLMRRAGFSGLKSGTSKQSARRFSESERQRLLSWMRAQAALIAGVKSGGRK